MTCTSHYRALALLIIALAPQAMAQGNTTIPARSFFQHAQFSNVVISPDGKYLALAGPVKGQADQVQIDVVDIAQAGVYAHYSLNEAVPSGIWWVNNSQFLFTTAYQFSWFDQPIQTGQVWVMNIKTGETGIISRNGGVYRVLHRDGGKVGYANLYNRGFVKFDAGAKFAGDNRDMDFEYVPPCSGQDANVAPQADEIQDRHHGNYYDDNAGYARLWLGYNGLTYMPEMAYSLPCDKDDRWYDISRFIASEPRYVSHGPWLFTTDDKQFYYAGLTPAGTIGLYLVDPLSFKKTMLYDDPQYDIENLFSDARWLVSDDGESLLAFEYMADRPVWILIKRSAPEVELLAKLEQQFADENVQITSRTLDGRLTVFFVSSDRDPGAYYLYDAKSGKSLRLFKILPGIDPDAMASMQPIQFKARDGLTIHGYLTLPLGQTKNLPLIVFPHGGPFGIRDNWGFNPDAQFLAYHGYAVLQIEFRGSGGYGAAFQKAGYRQWGGAMQDDLTEGTHWAIQQGVADPKRICIYGASYGGYAALEAVVKEPDLYKCAVGYAGVYDLVSFHNRYHTLHFRSVIPAISTEMGDDEDYLKAHSPVFHVDKIKAALFLAHGGEDKTVPDDQADELRNALDKIHKPYEWLYFRNEGHGFYALADRVELYSKMLAFFDKNIGQQGSEH